MHPEFVDCLDQQTYSLTKHRDKGLWIIGKHENTFDVKVSWSWVLIFEGIKKA